MAARSRGRAEAEDIAAAPHDLSSRSETARAGARDAEPSRVRLGSGRPGSSAQRLRAEIRSVARSILGAVCSVSRIVGRRSPAEPIRSRLSPALPFA